MVVRLSAHQVLVTLSVSFLAGVLLGSLYTVQQPWLYIAMAVVCMGLGLRLYAWNFMHIVRPWVRMLCIFAPWVIVGFCLGCIRVQNTLAEPNQYASVLGSKIDLEALVVGEPDLRQNYQLIPIRPVGMTQNALVTVPLGGQYKYGDYVWVRGTVAAPKVFDDFDYAGYLARFNVFGLVRYPKMIVLKQNKGNWITGKLYGFKHTVITRILYLYGQEQGRLLLGILIGAKQGLPQTVIEYFSRTGTSHIMAVSGFNISIVLIAFGYASYLIGRRASNAIALLAVILFVIIAGPTSSVLRAAGMGIFVILAITGKRLYMPIGTLACVAAGMAACNPRIVYWDVGFQLSSMATLGILTCVPICERWISARFKFLEPVVVTAAAILFTAPISIWRFGTFSTVAVVVNAVVVPVVPVVMALGTLSLLPVLGPGFAFVCSWFLQFILWCVEFCARPAWASIHVALSGRGVALWYAGIVVCLYGLWRTTKR